MRLSRKYIPVSFFRVPFCSSNSWADRVKSEVGASVAWENDWGELYKPNAPKGYEDRIAQIEAQLKR